MKRLRIVVWVFSLLVLSSPFGVGQSAPSKATSASPELVGQLTKELSITPAQATGGAGALFGLAKSRLSAADFSKVAAAVPGMSSFLKAAPATSQASGFSGITSSLPGGLGGIASTAEAFQKLGLSPEMVGKFVPILTKFVESKGGTSVGSLLSGALK